MHKAKRFAMGGFNNDTIPQMPPGPGYGGVGLEEMPIYGGPAQLPSGPPKAVSPKLGQLATQQMRQQMQLQKASQQAVKQRMQEQKLQEHRLQQMARGTGPYRQNKPTTFSNTTPIAPRPRPLPIREGWEPVRPEMPPKDFGEPETWEMGGERVQSPYVSNGTGDISAFLKSFLERTPQQTSELLSKPNPVMTQTQMSKLMQQGMNQGMNGPMPTPSNEPRHDMNGPMPTPSMGMQPNIQNTLMPMQQGMNKGTISPQMQGPQGLPFSPQMQGPQGMNKRLPFSPQMQGMNKPQVPTPSVGTDNMGMFFKKGGSVKAFAKGGSIKAYAKGGSVSASSRGDGCAQRGKTRGTMR